MSIAVSITQDGTVLNTAGKYVDQDIVVGMSDSIKLPAQTFNPSASDQVIPSGKYLAGAQTVKACTGTKTITANGTHSVVGFANAAVNVPQNIEMVLFTNTEASARKLHIPVSNASRFHHAIILPSSQISSQLEVNTTYGMMELFGLAYTLSTNTSLGLALNQYDGVEILSDEVTFQSYYAGRYWGRINYNVLLW